MERQNTRVPGPRGGTAFDLVVIGGGAAGCVVAARTAAGANRSVLLLEAGPDRRGALPAEFRDGWALPQRQLDWGYASEPDARGEVESVRRMKLLGGTSWLTRFAVRGSPADYDGWAADGNPGWSFDDVLPYFTRLEADAEFSDRPWHGNHGPMPCARYPDLDLADVTGAALEALPSVGIPHVEDHNQPGAVGAGRMPMSSRDGVRVTTADAYLTADSSPAGLTIRAGAEVSDILFDGSRASGIRLVDGTVIEAGWVALCAGVYGSPAILMRSGVGPANHLQSMAIPVRVDLPGVGSNLADHPTVDVDCGAYRGRIRSAPILHVIGTFHSSSCSAGGAPDLMFWISDPGGEPPTFEIAVVLLKPYSRGHVRLRSANQRQAPAITLPGLDHPADVARLAEGYQRAQGLARSAGIARLTSGPSGPMPTERDARAGVKAERYSLPHTMGTCAMGPRPQDGAVVDSNGGVHGTEGLTVIDASIMPDVISGFPHIPTVMIAERLSEVLASRV
jgi:choline dehydrogenase-like flavoprotein